MTKKHLNELTYLILGCAIEVHKELGPGLLESIYEKCLAHLLRKKGVQVSLQQKVPLFFQGLYLECDLRYDMLVEREIVVEVKAVEALLPIHEAQLLSYLKLMKKAKGVLINFNCAHIMKEGQKTLVTNIFSQLPDGY